MRRAFLSSLESCRSVIADATLCHPELPSPPVSLQGGLYLSWHVPGCFGGGCDSLSRCVHPLHTVTCQTRALRLTSSCREESLWQYNNHITINLCTGPRPGYRDNEPLFPPLCSPLCSSEAEFPNLLLSQ